MNKETLIKGVLIILALSVVVQVYLQWEANSDLIIAVGAVALLGFVGYVLLKKICFDRLNKSYFFMKKIPWKEMIPRKLFNVNLIDEDNPDRVGWYFDVVRWNLLVRPIFSLIAGTAFALLCIVIDWTLGTDTMNVWWFTVITLSMAMFFGQSETVDEVVPEAHGAMLTFWGMRIRVYRQEGIYSWTGSRLGLRRSKTVHSEGTDSNGFIKLQPFPVSIWNQMNERGKVMLETVARDTSKVFTTLTITIQLMDPRRWLDSADPTLDLAEQARTAFRTSVSFFTGVDCTSIKSVFGTLMLGQSVLTVFLPKNIRGYSKGSIIRTSGGSPLYEIIPQDATEEAVKKLTADFTKKISIEADKEMYGNCFTEGRPDIEIRDVEKAFTDVLVRLGAKLIKAAVGNVQLSNEVSTKANEAASEQFQRDAQVASAQATAEGIKILDEATRNVSELVTAITASKDYPGVKVVVTGSGSNSLTSAAATHATLTGER